MLLWKKYRPILFNPYVLQMDTEPHPLSAWSDTLKLTYGASPPYIHIIG